ncbi:hypothetical protein J2Z66_003601 [Paenibacillus eucommiae]|uniref:Uncharacterized protein n=1 Tax=Paenibacillus eucommiae TaxID=1355755 RepID=A0ABS4IWV1_9BACL|nr:hypothetical protein [Paenibacillus eucommiae]
MSQAVHSFYAPFSIIIKRYGKIGVNELWMILG